MTTRSSARRPRRLRIVVVALAAAVAGAGSATVATPAGPDPDASARPAAGGSPADGLPAGLAPVVAAALAPPEYHAGPAADGLAAANPAQGLAVGFSPAGVQVEPTAGGPALALSLARLGREGRLVAPAPAQLVGQGARVEYRRGKVTEWYVNDPRGVEQGFTLDAAPPGDPTKPVVVELASTGSLRPALDRQGASIRFEGPGATTVHYGGLHAFDATGRPLPSRLGLAGANVTLTVDDDAAAYPLTIDPLIATEEAHLLASDSAATDRFGSSVAVSGDTAVVGAPSDDTPAGADAGSAYVFVRSGATWTQQAHLLASDAGAVDQFGSSVAVSGDTAVVGAPLDDTPAGADAGSAYVFVRSGDTWTQQAHLLASDSGAVDQFGSSVAVSGDTAVVGALFDDTAVGDGAGSAYVFVRSGPSWTEQAHLFASDAAAFDNFGSSVAVSGDTAVVGAPIDDTPAGGSAGSAYVFVRSGATWTEQAHLFASDAAGGEWFGWSAAVSGDTAVVGAPFDTTPSGGNAGSAYVFVRSGATWTQQSHLFASDGAGADFFGFSVAVSGDTAVVGAPSDDTPAGADAGSAYVFVRSGATWTQQSHLFASDGAATDLFGESVAVSGDTAVVGAPLEDTLAGADAGSAYVYRLTSAAPQSLPGVVANSTNWSRRDSLTTGAPTGTFTYGTRPPALVPLAGDWDGDGDKTPGIFQGGAFKLSDSYDTNLNPAATFTFGDARGFPVAGDFDGDGRDDVAVFRGGVWQVRYADDGATATFTYGSGTWPTVVPVAGDWDGDGVDGIGYYCRDNTVCPAGTWHLRQTATAGPDQLSFTYDPGTSPYPVVGDWDADGDDTVGVKAGATWLLNNANDASAPEVTFEFGGANDLPIVWAQ